MKAGDKVYSHFGGTDFKAGSSIRLKIDRIDRGVENWFVVIVITTLISVMVFAIVYSFYGKRGKRNTVQEQ